MMAVVIEVLQRHRIGRASQLDDLWLDGIGIVVGSMIVIVLSTIYQLVTVLRARRVSGRPGK